MRARQIRNYLLPYLKYRRKRSKLNKKKPFKTKDQVFKHLASLARTYANISYTDVCKGEQQ